jgi:hypothetical protein
VSDTRVLVIEDLLKSNLTVRALVIKVEETLAVRRTTAEG